MREELGAAAPAGVPAEEEIDVKRYDRQIRLWGIDTQRGLQSARVLLLRANGLCNEIAKNLVLAGVGHVCIQDPDLLVAADLQQGGLFHVSAAQLGSNKAAALADGLRPLNPHGKIMSEARPIGEIGDEVLRSYHYVIATHGLEAIRELCDLSDQLDDTPGAPPPSKRQRTEAAAPTSKPPSNAKPLPNGQHELLPMRAAPAAPRPKLLAAGAMGLFGFCALDLSHYEFTPKPKAVAEGEAPPPAAAPKHMLYPSLAQAFAVDCGVLTKRVPRLYPALQLLLQAGGKQPEGELDGARSRMLEAAHLAEDFLREPLDGRYVAQVARHVGTEMPAVCAIVGGMVAAEVIKIIESKEAPFNNLFLFDATSQLDATGVAMRFGPSFQCPWGVDRGAPREV